MDGLTLLIGVGLMLTGAIFFGYPLGLRHGAKSVADEASERILNAEVIE